MLESNLDPVVEQNPDDDISRWEDEGGSCTKQNDDIKNLDKKEYQGENYV